MAYGRKRMGGRKRTMRKTSASPFKRVNTRRLVAKAKTKSLVKLIKNVSLKQAETCYKTFSVKSVAGSFNGINHDSLSSIAIWTPTGSTSFWPVQGNSDGERRGDEIIATGFRYRGVFQCPSDRRNTIVKIWYVPFNTSQGDPNIKSQFFHLATNNVILDPIQTDRWPGTKYLGSLRFTGRDQPADSQDKTVFINRWIPLKRKITFRSDGENLLSGGVKGFGYIVMAAYDSISSSTTDTIISRSEHSFTLYYKDP